MKSKTIVYLETALQAHSPEMKDVWINEAITSVHGPENTFDILKDIVAKTTCKKGWSFRLHDEDGALRLVITIDGYDNYHHDKPFRVAHYIPVPITTYNEKSWRRWVFDACLAVEVHEMGEAFKVGDERPFEPCHGPGENPYTVHEYRPMIDALTTQDGSIREAA